MSGGAPTGASPPNAGPPSAPAPDAPPPANPRGTPRAAAIPRMETVRVTAPDLARRAALEKTRSRLLVAAAGFALLFGAVVAKLAEATILFPVMPRRIERPVRTPDPSPPPGGATVAGADGTATETQPRAPRAMIVDRNNQILAVSLPTAALYANPREMIDINDAAHKLKLALPRLDEQVVRARLGSGKQFVYLARQLTPREQLALNALGIPGVYFETTERRRYPQGRVAAHVLGGVDVDAHGIAGVERYFDQRLREDPEPLRLSIDVRVQGIVRDELARAKDEFGAIGACGIVMDVRTGEVLAMVSLPDYDANDVGHAPADDRFNRAVTGMYEPGSTFKLQTVSMALDFGVVNIWNGFDASEPIKIGRFTISDFEGKHRYLSVPEIIAYSSNIGAARMAFAVGGERQRAWLQRMGMFDRLAVELPEAGRPIVPPVSNWGEAATMTIGFGHGVAVSPLHVVAGTSAIANGGVYFRPTLLAPEPGMAPREGNRVMQQSTSDTARKLMRLVVTEGYGKPAEVVGYYVGGKTGTAEKISHRAYNHNSRVAAFMSAFPMNAPRYAVYMMLDEPHATAATHGFATAGWVVAPSAGRVISRIAPMLGLFPDTQNRAAIDAALYIPLQPGRPAGRAPGQPAAPRPAPPVASTPAPVPTGTPPRRDPATLRNEASTHDPDPSRLGTPALAAR